MPIATVSQMAASHSQYGASNAAVCVGASQTSQAGPANETKNAAVQNTLSNGLAAMASGTHRSTTATATASVAYARIAISSGCTSCQCAA